MPALLGQSTTAQQGSFTQIYYEVPGLVATIVPGQMRPGWRIFATLPSLTAFGQMSNNPRATGAPFLPKVRAVGYGGGNAVVTLPTVTVSVEMTIPNIGRAAISLPSVTVSGSLLVGLAASAAVQLKAVQALGYDGSRAAIVLPRVLAAGIATVQEHATAAISLPHVQAVGAGSLWSEVAYAAIVLPNLYAGSGAFAGIVLPRLIAAGTAVNDVSANLPQAWAMNIATGAVTRFTNFPFRVFMRFENRYYGIGMAGGLYLLDGDTDAGQPIMWEFETGLDDLDNPAQKGILGVYVDGVFEKGADLTLITDSGARYKYPMHAPTNKVDHKPYRVSTGRGIRTRNIGIAIGSDVGGYAEVDQIAPDFVISKRSI